MPLEPTMYHCGVYGCITPAHDVRDEHVHTFNEATRQYLKALAVANAKRTVPQTLVKCMRPDCTTPPHGQHITHKHTFNKKGKN